MATPNDLTTLVSAANAKKAAKDAPIKQQMCAVAYAINTAANCGQLTVYFNQPLLAKVKSDLESKGYKITQVGKADREEVTMISWTE